MAGVRPILLKWAGDPVAALAGLDELRARAAEEGNDGLAPYLAGHVPGVLLHLGRLNDAAAAAIEHLALAEQTGQETQRTQALYNIALVDAHLGRLDQAEAAATEILEWTVDHDDRWLEMSATSVLGLVALTRGNHVDACSWFARWTRAADELRMIDPGITRFYGDHIEALVGCGAIDEAVVRTDVLEQRARRAGRICAAAIASRCRALLAATAGDLDAALALVDESLQFDNECTVPFERQRTMLLAGIIHRRGRHKSIARVVLSEASASFTAMGAAGWAERCQQELSRVGAPARSATELTVTEQRIAELAASGLTNRQVAERAFVSPKTVEANLVRIYRKLGITSRAELGARMG
ncbi:MAG: transcriptional regulator, luxR family [Ilumatobacteraceae bacterium]|nr:transcriptional regulator, luxR family [Ilumatobacteraceae bacterium]